ncbi:MAG: DotU family type IV/VI secretion system protein [Deltaproteobacteria bacterium]|jgi:type VI secretion system protein ImpK|nr:DotU family type IV/VI secretion system protein [Deltaproteobacteria bacterium]MBK8240564.1 DotU family type IV/VI secretion system protein [Deltaproteobacteria bacterium]MBP7292196.1 DotU family type IV/VI secretion system protein [Nannocystaceae bacterium]
MDRVNELTKDCFDALIQLRNVADESLLAPEMFHARVIGFIDELFRSGPRMGLVDRDLHDIAYAVVALADEVAMRKTGSIRDVWMSKPLQLHYFNENLAGEGFFHRLEATLGDPRRVDVLRVYYLCLLFGFQGRYAVRGGELELAAVQRRVRDVLGIHARPEPLSKHHLRPRERVDRAQQYYVTVWIGLLAVLFSLALIIVLRKALDRQSSNISERIEALLPDE